MANLQCETLVLFLFPRLWKALLESTAKAVVPSDSPLSPVSPPPGTLLEQWYSGKGGGLPGTTGNTGKQWKLSLLKLVGVGPAR